MTIATELELEPWRFDVLALMRRVERSFPDQPRIGNSATRREDYIALGEDPYLAFAPSTIAKADRDAQGRLRLFVKFLGLLGPQGALPLATTDEIYTWWLARDDAFPRFLDLLNHRFLQLFFRAWADVRPIAQADRPALDRFVAYIGSPVGLGSPAFRDLDSVPDRAKIGFAGLLGAKAKSPSRLRNAVAGILGVTVEVEEFVGTVLEFDPADCTRLGQRHARLGSDLLLGAGVYSVEDKFRLRIYARDLAQFEQLLPSGSSCEPLADLVFFHMGDEFEWDVELGLPERAVRPVSLGQFGRLGYTSWMTGSEAASTAEGYRLDARFHPAERVAERRRAEARAA